MELLPLLLLRCTCRVRIFFLLPNAEDRLLRKKLLQPGDPQVPVPCWGQEVTVRLQGVLEDRTVVEKDCKLVFVIGERDVIQVIL